MKYSKTLKDRQTHSRKKFLEQYRNIAKGKDRQHYTFPQYYNHAVSSLFDFNKRSAQSIV